MLYHVFWTDTFALTIFMYLFQWLSVTKQDDHCQLGWSILSFEKFPEFWVTILRLNFWLNPFSFSTEWLSNVSLIELRNVANTVKVSRAKSKETG